MDFGADSLPVDYLGIGVFSLVNNLTTWIAALVVATAFSLWKLRNSSPSSVKPIEDAASEERRVPTVETTSSLPSLAAPVLAPVKTASDAMVFGATKGKMTVFFGDDAVERKEGAGKDFVSGGDDVEGAAEEWWWSGWEKVLRVRRGETEWYSCQDVTFINGDVVRLWKDVKLRRSLGRCNG